MKPQQPHGNVAPVHFLNEWKQFTKYITLKMLSDTVERFSG